MTSPVPTSILAGLASAQASLMPSIGVVSRPVRESGRAGTQKRSTPTAVGEWACNVTPMGDQQRKAWQDRITGVATHALRFPGAADVEIGDTVTVAGTAYTIMGTDNERTDKLYLLTVGKEIGGA